MTQPLQNKVVLITGASGGIGAATAFSLSNAGATVVLLARSADKLNVLKTEIEASGGSALVMVADITNTEQASAAVSAVLDAYGQLDILVNNAGVYLPDPLLSAPLASWHKTINVNVIGLLNITHAALPIMQLQRSGHIINMSSITAHRVRNTASTIYTASKAAVNSISEGLRQEGTTVGIRVTTIEPGMVNTKIFDKIENDDSRKAAYETIENMTALDPEDIADAILYAVTAPRHVNINTVTIRPSEQRS